MNSLSKCEVKRWIEKGYNNYCSMIKVAPN